MRPHPSVRWLWGMAFLLVLGPALLWWLLTPPTGIYPVTWFMPDRTSAALRLSRLEPAWQRHWQRRAQTTPEGALRELLDALDKWPDWVKDHGEHGANTRLWLYQRALFTAVGEEGWIVFGEWGGAQDGAGQVGLVALIRSQTSVASRFGELMNLVMSNYRLSTKKFRGVTIYEYQDRKVSRNVTFCQTGGWICASLQQRGTGPLPAIITRVQERRADAVPQFVADWWAPELPNRERPAISAAAWPERFWGQLRLFRQQRGERISGKSEERIGFWQQRLDGIERIELVQTGESLFDLKMELIGPRPAQLTKSLGFKANHHTSGTVATERNDNGPQLAQLDLSLGLARLLTPLAGLPTGDVMKGLEQARPWLGLLSDELRNRIEDLPPDVEGRLGVALYPGMLVPQGTVWFDDAPERLPAASPGQYWPRLASATPDHMFRVPALVDMRTTGSATSAPDAGWLDFEKRIWLMDPPRPALFATVHFERVTNEIRHVPRVLVSKKIHKRLRRSERVLSALALATGGAALRIDPMSDRWIVRLETP